MASDARNNGAQRNSRPSKQWRLTMRNNGVLESVVVLLVISTFARVYAMCRRDEAASARQPGRRQSMESPHIGHGRNTFIAHHDSPASSHHLVSTVSETVHGRGSEQGKQALGEQNRSEESPGWPCPPPVDVVGLPSQ
jgi:hypothetical protein